jgi:hypothetical protein
MSAPAESGAAIIEALTQRYAAMRSYQDRGVVRNWLMPGEPPIETPFETSYSAPNLFRFSFDCPHPFPPLAHIVTRYVVGFDGHRAYVWRQHADDAPELDVASDISMMVGGVACVSSGASHIITRLLLPQVGGIALRDLRDLSVVGGETVDGVPCRRVSGTHPKGQGWVMVIERESNLLRSVARGAKDIVQQHQAIQVNESIDVSTFAVPN